MFVVLSLLCKDYCCGPCYLQLGHFCSYLLTWFFFILKAIVSEFFTAFFLHSPLPNFRNNVVGCFGYHWKTTCDMLNCVQWNFRLRQLPHRKGPQVHPWHSSQWLVNWLSVESISSLVHRLIFLCCRAFETRVPGLRFGGIGHWWKQEKRSIGLQRSWQGCKVEGTYCGVQARPWEDVRVSRWYCSHTLGYSRHSLPSKLPPAQVSLFPWLRSLTC